MKIPGWQFLESKMTYLQESGDKRRIVGRLDGWNWGWLVLNPDGSVLAGCVNSQMDVFDAAKQAESH